MDPAAYDLDARERRSVTRLVFWMAVSAGCLFVFVNVYALLIGPYATFVYDRQVKIGHAKAYITKETCTNSETIVEVGSYSVACEDARRVITQGVWIGAFNDLMNDLKMCKQGVCRFLGINFTNVLFFLAVGGLAALVVAWCMGVIQLGSSYHARQIGLYQLPATMYGAAQPAYMQQQQQTIKSMDSYTMPMPRAYLEHSKSD